MFGWSVQRGITEIVSTSSRPLRDENIRDDNNMLQRNVAAAPHTVIQVCANAQGAHKALIVRDTSARTLLLMGINSYLGRVLQWGEHDRGSGFAVNCS